MDSAATPPQVDAVRIDVSTASRAYAITIADGAIDRLRRTLAELKLPERRFVVSSPLVWRLHGPQLARALGAVEPILVPDGERFKQLPTVTRIYDHLISANADQDLRPHPRWQRHRRQLATPRPRIFWRAAHPRADDPARADQQLDRRQGGRQSSTGKT
jgi:hypothetical protein